MANVKIATKVVNAHEADLEKIATQCVHQILELVKRRRAKGLHISESGMTLEMTLVVDGQPAPTLIDIAIVPA